MPTEPDPIFLPGEQVGDYLLDDRISIGTNTSSWDATQVSVQREVILCILDTEHISDPETRDAFIEDIRSKASVDQPLVASILEAVNEGPLCYYAVEKLPGETLGELHEQGISITPIQAARIIRNISDAFDYLETKCISTLPLSQHDIYVDDKYHCRIVNMAISGPYDLKVASRDMGMVGHLIQDMVEPNQPGSTRINSLLSLMADLERREPLSWNKVHDLSGEIERQLAKPSEYGQIKSPTMRMSNSTIHYLHHWAFLGKLLIAIIALLIVGGLVFYYINNRTILPEKRQLQDMVHIPAGKYPGPNGFYMKTPEFWMDAHEVTIGEYAEFLEALRNVSAEVKADYQHQDQPAKKTSHEPDDWKNLRTAATQGLSWKNLKIDLNYPVVGVDWWDAHAYAVWSGRQLPTHEEWYAACSSGSNPEELAGTGWKPVDQTEKTSLGLYGMAGNVSEWMREKTLNPADPSLPPRYLISGASYMRPKFGAQAREWVDTRSLRRPDLGFRTYSISRQED